MNAEKETERAVGRMFPIIGQNAFVPWDFVQPHERWALNNHSQTVQRLADRGGLSWCELCAVIEHRRWQQMDPERAPPTKAVARVLGHLIAWYEARTAPHQESANPSPPHAEDAARGPRGPGFTYHLDECPKSRGSISGCICRDDEHCANTRERP